MSAILTAADRESDHSFVGHPRGLAYLAFAEGWERFTAERITADPDYRSGIALCAKQLRETIASAKQDEEN